MTRVCIAIFGVGGVGKAFISQLQRYADSRKPGLQVHVILISSSTKMIASAASGGGALDLQDWEENLKASTIAPPSIPQGVLSLLGGTPHPVILVDNTSSQALAEAYPRFLEAGIHVVTPNKKAFSSSLELFKEIAGASAAGGMYLHEATVGAGLPVLSTLADLRETGDDVYKIEGVFSGTMSYLFNSFAPTNPGASAPPRAFSDCVKEARALGYTEPDPRDDLNGMDVARKLTILARLCGMDVAGPTEFPTMSLIPKELESAASAEEYLEGLPAFDGAMDATRGEAEREGKVVRYVGSLDLTTKELSVGLKAFEKDSAIAGLKGSDNIISFYTRRYGQRPLVVQGAGAGAEVTAMGVLGDLTKVVKRLEPPPGARGAYAS